MNRVYKTKWSAAHQQYVVTDEHHATKGKASKSAIAIAVAALMMAAGAQAAYYEGDTSFVAKNNTQLDAARQSFETAEYNANWGLKAMKASTAYALGFHGQGVKVGMMDSGILKGHSEFSDKDRWHGVEATGTYTHDGSRYPQYAYQGKNENGENRPGKDTHEFTKDGQFTVNGWYDKAKNDNHGTGCAGVYAGDRDGSQMHGVAWGSDFYSANTGGTDDMNYGPFQDYGFFKVGYDKLVESGVKIINNSFGTNLKQVDPETNKILDYYHSGPELTTVNDIEYEYFLFKKAYKNDSNGSFVDAAFDAVNNKDVIQVFTTGNNDRANPYHRALYPYFRPEAESRWIAVAGIEQVNKNTDPNNYQLKEMFNEAGFAKYWTLTGPSMNGYTANISGGYGGYSGTSMAAPFISGAFGVLASRYPEMTALQVREVLLTTANHKNADGSDMEGWANADKSTPAEGEVSDRMGWGVPDLEKGMYGLGQTLGHFDYKLTKKDVWSNDISQVALEQRYREDIAWLKSALKDNVVDFDQLDPTKESQITEFNEGDFNISNDPNDYKLTNTSTGSANADGKEHNYDLAGIDKEITLDDAKKWRLEYYQKRAEEIRKKLNKGLYTGSLTKSGEGTLIMTGDNSYKGDTTVKGGTLLAFAESIGNDKVKVEQDGKFGVLSSYNDQFTMKGHLVSKEADAAKLKVEIAEGGTLVIDAASNVVVDTVKFNGAKKFDLTLEGADGSTLSAVWNGEKDAITGSFEAKNNSTTETLFGDSWSQEVKSDFLFFDVAKATGAGNKATVTMTKKEGVTVEQFAKNANEERIAAAIAASGNELSGQILSAKKDNVSLLADTFSTLDDDFYATARNALVVNATAVSRTVMDQARGMGEGRSAEVDNGRARIWAAGVGHWGEAEGNRNTMDVDFRAGFLGAEALVLDNTKFGAFFGYGTTDYKSGVNKIDGDDKHFGLYGLTDIGSVTMTYGVAYTDQDRDTTRVWGTTMNQHSENASVLQGFVEGAYNFDLSVAKVSPYVGFTWARVETDAVVDNAIGHSFKTDEIKDDIQIATLGVRTAVPFAMGNMPVALTADLGWSHYFGDTEGLVNVQMGEGGKFAAIEGSELKDQANLGLGIVGQVAKHATVGVSYSGSWGSDINTHGIFANVRFNF
ncbi:MAG: autotransporter domain-containing protein [Sutterella wadsworthensis]